MITVSAGKYIISDPCYVIKDEHWDLLLENSQYFENPIGEIFGHKILAFGTFYGDGCYQDNFGKSYFVDAGIIGIVPFEYLEEFEIKIESNWNVVTFENDFDCYEENGKLVFGHIEIETNESEDEEMWEDDEEF